MSAIVNKEFYTLSEIQELFRISKPTAIRLIHSEGFPKLTAVGKRLLVPIEPLKQWCIDNTTWEALEKVQSNFENIQKLSIGGN